MEPTLPTANISATKARSRERPPFEYLWKSYVGFLEGTGKSRATISSYESDLSLFRDFLHARGFDFYEMRPEDFGTYLAHLERLGLKTNTRRRKLLTVRSLYRYALSRKKIRLSPAQFVKAPARLERLPWIPKKNEMEALVAKGGKASPSSQRNRVLLALLLESGLQVAELCGLAWEGLQGRTLSVGGKRPRKLPLSRELAAELRAWRKHTPGRFLFPGFNRHGITSAKMTPRGVELLFRKLARENGLPRLKPKTVRHYVILSWLETNIGEPEILRRLGVSATYSLEPYRKWLRDR